MLEKFGVDGTRYLLMSAGTFGEDVDVTMERMVEKYNADLANGLGNLVSRVVKMLRNTKSEILNPKQIQNSKSEIRNFILNLEINQALEHVWNIIRRDDKFVEDNKPWELAKNDEKKFEEVMKKLVSDLYLISELVVFFMPETAEKIKKALGTKKANILFPRVK
jgi:methionyl-tRNA synthetase